MTIAKSRVRTAAVDVLIPAFNAADTIDEALESMLAQTFEDFRVIVVDDGSDDTTLDRLHTARDKDPRIEILETRHLGVANALNFGLNHCTAPYVARFDADDVSFHDRLEHQHAYLAANADCVALDGDVEHIDADGAPIANLPKPGDPGSADPHATPAEEPYLVHPFLMVRRNALTAAGGYRDLPCSVDTDLYWRLRHFGAFKSIPRCLGKYRVHANSISGASSFRGRRMAVISQLTALSAIRRERGLSDLTFPLPTKMVPTRGDTIGEMVQKLRALLRDEEALRLPAMASGKLMELATYRPFELSSEDCAFVADAIDRANELPVHDCDRLRWYRSATAGRLLRAGRLREAQTLVGCSGLPKATARAAAHVLHLKRATR